MSTSMGFRYLYEAGHIEKEIEIWFHVSIVYVYILVLAETRGIGTELVVCRRH
jgi:rapamycin-insensitive companion of mTOR